MALGSKAASSRAAGRQEAIASLEEEALASPHEALPDDDTPPWEREHPDQAEEGLVEQPLTPDDFDPWADPDETELDEHQ